MKNPNWYALSSPENVVSPALLVYPERVKFNLQKMIEMAGGTEFLRPHIKTHKMAEIIRLQIEAGIYKFKCATLAEAELLAVCEAKDVLLAMQPVGANVARFFDLTEKFPAVHFSVIVDNQLTVNEISKISATRKQKTSLWLDINNGMNRTGIIPGKEAFDLYKSIAENPCLTAEGLHVYDGHIHEPDFALRKEICDRDFEPAARLQSDLQKAGFAVALIAGGTPSFPVHVHRENTETSPGTPLLWDAGYAANYRDLKFLPAAVLFMRTVSKPRPDFACFDLGHKAVASEMPLPRVEFLGASGFTQKSQSEEHLVVEFAEETGPEIGEAHYALPIHICPTVSKYKSVLTVVDGKITGSWEIAARDHKINI